MKPARVDFAVDLAYGVLLLVAVLIMLFEGTTVGIAFGVGIMVSYALHVGWKMARYDPDWMTQTVEATVEEAVEETVEDTVEDAVEETVEDTVSEEVDSVIDQVEEINQRIDRRPRTDEIEDQIEELTEDKD